MNNKDRMNAYYRLTREIRSMHHTERTALDNSANYLTALTAVHEGRDSDAIALTDNLMTEAGDAWRAKQDITSRTN